MFEIGVGGGDVNIKGRGVLFEGVGGWGVEEVNIQGRGV